jgi:HD-GYP domain-containing protein (c-di-GMP phosphodiesterase class II)
MAFGRHPDSQRPRPYCFPTAFGCTLGLPRQPRSAMSGKRQIWYLEGSAAERLVAPLRRSYDLRPVPKNGYGHSHGAAKAVTKMNGAPAVWLADMRGDAIILPANFHTNENASRVIGIIPSESKAVRTPRVVRTARSVPARAARRGLSVFAYLPSRAPREVVMETVAAAFKNIELATRERVAREALKVAEHEREQLNKIGMALSSQRDVNALLNQILSHAREVTGADAGSLYLVEDAANGGHQLRFMLTQNDSLTFPFQELTLPLTDKSMAGYSALHAEVLNYADAYKIPRNRPFRFNDSYDRETGYRTRSILTLPMRNAKDQVLGILQLINAKKNRAARLATQADVARQVQPFRDRAVRMALSLGSQAAVAYENRKLYTNIEQLFEGFVQAAVKAIEQRDPTTSGHSVRVATYTEALATVVDSVSDGPYSNARFTPEQMKEIRYAALLHDFGKVGVREEVLVKAKKLQPLQLELVRQRFDYIRKEVEASIVRRKLQVFLERDRGDALSEVARLSEDFEQRLKRIDEYFEFVLEANEPTILEQGQFRRLRDIAQNSFIDPIGVERPYLSPDEVRMLSIPKGSLDASERQQIESHVVHTFNFLTQIPWTKELMKIPEIARAHHEKLNGTGYPYKLWGDEIPLPAKMMTVCDIFDALTASDRPYKRAVPIDRALAILDDCVRANEIDPDLMRLFREARIYEKVARPPGE